MRPPAPPPVKRRWRVDLGGRAHKAGHAAEWTAAALLMLKGWQILAFRLRTRNGEIDILARRGRTLAVVEVKRRATLEQALTAVTVDQQERLLAAGRAVLRQRPSLAGHLLQIHIVALAPRRFPRHRRLMVPAGRGRP